MSKNKKEQTVTDPNMKKLWLGLAIVCVIFVIPIFLFPVYPQNPTQFALLDFVVKHLNIRLGLNGPLPFFTIMSTVYLLALNLLIAMIASFYFFKKIGCGHGFQLYFYKKFFQAKLKYSDKYSSLEHPFIKILLVSLLYIAAGLMFTYHLSMENITLHHSRRSGLFALLYQSRVGVIFLEFLNSIFIIFSAGYIFFLCIYLFNFFIRGLGLGKPVEQIPLPKNKVNKKKHGNHKLR